MIIMTKPKVYSNEMDYYFSQFIFTHWNKTIYWMKTKTVNLYEKKLLVTKGINIARIREGIKYGKLIFINSNYYVGLKTSYFDRRKCAIFLPTICIGDRMRHWTHCDLWLKHLNVYKEFNKIDCPVEIVVCWRSFQIFIWIII